MAGSAAVADPLTWRVAVVAGDAAAVGALAPLVADLRGRDRRVDPIVTIAGGSLMNGAALGSHRNLGGAPAESATAELADLLTRLGDFLAEVEPAVLIVHGDGPVALAAALAASHRDVPVMHAGGRDGGVIARLATLPLTGGATAPAAAVVGWLAARDRPATPTVATRRELWVAGFPSAYGGADTELDHQIALWRRHDVDVHLVPMFGVDADARRRQIDRGCQVHDYRDDVFRGRIVVSYCNGEFLAHLPRIMAAGRPAKVIWFNCMTWLFDGEREAHRQGWIDAFGFVSAYQRGHLEPQLAAIRPQVPSFAYRPYFDASIVEWRYRPWDGCYKIGRISRDDMGKYAADTWRIFDRVLVPPGLQKKVYLLGYGPNAAAKIGSAPPGLDWQTWGPAGISATDFYRTIDTLMHKTGGSRESYCRVVIEAYAHGVVPIVEDDYAFPEIVIHEETGIRTSDSDEMSWWASMLARHPDRHRAMAERGRRYLLDELSDERSCWAGWQSVLS